MHGLAIYWKERVPFAGTSAISTPLEIALGTKTTRVFLPADREASLLFLPRLVSLLLGSIVQPENIYSCILKVTGQV